MQIEIRNAASPQQREAVGQILIGALEKQKLAVSKTEARIDQHETEKGVDIAIQLAPLLIGVLNSSEVQEQISAGVADLLAALRCIFQEPANKKIECTVDGFTIGSDDILTGRIDSLGRWLQQRYGDVKAVTRYALLIGMSHSAKDESIPKLKYTENDVNRVFNLLCAEQKAIRLLNPLLNDMRENLYKILVDRLPQDEVIIYYSGHGFRTRDGAFLCCHDTRMKDLAISAFDIGDIAQFTRSSQASKVLVVLDCCYSGAAADTLFGEEILAGAADKSVELIASTARDMTAKEFAEKQMGMFSYYFLTGCETGGAANGTGRVTAEGIYKYIRNKMEEDGKRGQSPRYNAHNKHEDFVIKTTVADLNSSFKKVENFLRSKKDSGELLAEDVLKVLINCFGSADAPEAWNIAFIESVKDFEDKIISLSEFKKRQGLKLPLQQSFNEMKALLQKRQESGELAAQDVKRVLRNCFGSADVPKVENQKYTKIVADYAAGQISAREFKREQRGFPYVALGITGAGLGAVLGGPLGAAIGGGVGGAARK